MLFDSLTFLVFFALVLALHWLMPARAHNLFLIVASYVFYGSWSWKFLVLIVASGLVDYSLSLAISRSTDPVHRRRFLWLSLAFNLTVLGFFKYFNFFVGDILGLLTQLGISYTPPLLDIILPIGISFFTFQSMGYILDVYAGRVRPPGRLTDYLLFVCFFPQMVAGPIERATSMLPQIAASRSLTPEAFNRGCLLILLGLFKKLAVADHLGMLVDASFMTQTNFKLLLTVYFFAFQIYCDFSGYTDIARGTAALLGFNLRHNFNHPYAATGPADFWHRWHMSLSTWFRDYVYIPLGGSRTGPFRHYRNILVSFLLSGLWHGANWTFVIWGFYHGVLVATERAIKSRWQGLDASLAHSRAARAVAILVTFHLVCVGWVFFRARSFSDALDVFARLFVSESRPFADTVALINGLTGLCILLAIEAVDRRHRLEDLPSLHKAAACAVGVIFILLCGQMNGGQFIYFQF